jgi:ABC-2 type transport system permease protein
MQILNIAKKDWMQIFRDWKSGLFLVAMPILFTLFFGMVMGSALNPPSDGDTRLPVGVVNLDLDGSLSREIQGLLEKSSSIRPIEFSDPDLEKFQVQVEDGELAAAVIIPKGYSKELLAGNLPSWQVVIDRSSPAGETASTAIETSLNRLRSAVKTADLSQEVYADNKGFDSDADRQAYMVAAVKLALEEWQSPSLGTERILATGKASPSGGNGQLDGFVQASSGMMVQFAIFGLITAAMVLVLERKNKTLQRLLTTPIKRWEVIAGHTLAMFVVIFLQETLLVVFGQLAFGVEYFREPFATLLMMAVLALWAASLGLLISALSQTEEQVVTLSLIAMFLFASLGGAWFPLEVAGETFAAIGHIMPTAWAMDGFQNLLMRGLGFGSVLLPAGMLSLYTLAFFGLAVWRFKFE